MRVFNIATAGLLAAGGLIMAELYPLLRVADINLTLQLSKTSWGGSGRLWFAAALMIVATLVWALDARRWPGFLSGAALGLMGDICFSAWRWRSDQLETAQALGLGLAKPTIEWQLGALGFAAAILLTILFFIRSAYPSRPPKIPAPPAPSVAAAIAGQIHG